MKDYIICDLETTGLNPNSDRIIEIAMIKVRNFRVADSYHTLINPQMQLPLKIKQLTGLNEIELENSPTLDKIIPYINSFMDELPVVGHNVEFDKSFLTSAVGSLPFTAYLDTYELARILYPTFNDYSLMGLAQKLSLLQQPSHRALEDCISTAELLASMYKKLNNLNKNVLNYLIELLNKGNSPWAEILSTMFNYSLHITEPFTGHFYIFNNTGQKETKTGNLESTKLEDYFKDKGILSNCIPNFRLRTGQYNMAKTVWNTLEQKKLCFIEAGTGTGKTIAYLLPALIWAGETKQQVVVSTNTINLQEQIRQKDIPILEKAMNAGFEIAVLKGRQNYICLRRFFNKLATGELYGYNAMSMSRFLIWLLETNSGDKNELNMLKNENQQWLRVCSYSESCKGSLCHWQHLCFVHSARVKAESSQVIITNHSLLFSDLIAEKKILPHYQALIIDEAHHLEESANKFLGKKLAFLELYHWLSSTGINLTKLKDNSHELPKDLFNKASYSVNEALNAVNTFTKHFIGLCKKQLGRGKSKGTTKIRLYQDSGVILQMQGDYLNLIYHLMDFNYETKELISKISRHYSEQNNENHYLELVITCERADKYIEDLKAIWESSQDEFVCWAEIPETSNHLELDCVLYAAPIDISHLMREKFFNESKGIVITSATLSVNHSFGHLISQWGLEQLSPDRMDSIMVESPFNYNQQCLFSIVNDLPEYIKEEEYLDAITKAIFYLTKRIGGRTLVLFTSHSTLKEVYKRVKPEFEKAGICLLGHKIDGARTKLVREFIKAGNNVLFGASSFWDGIDISGNALAQVIIVKLPFSPPSEPILQARMEKAKGSEISSFYELSLPRAVIRFKQGFGRLIRSESDKGAVVLLDGRIMSKRYGKYFINSLPINNYVIGDLDKVLNELTNWLN